MTNKLIHFIGNWKMFGDFSSIKIINKIDKFFSVFKKKHKKNKIVLCVPNPLIYFLSKNKKVKNISIGAQNCHHEKHGPFTGSVSAAMIKNSGAKFVILGHSDNRSEGDTNKKIKNKIASALEEKLNVIFCIGETLKQKKEKKTFSVLKKQLKESLIKSYDIEKIMVAYEPIWSIGTGKIPKINELVKIFTFIKKEIKKILKTKKRAIVLYGGSVNDKNVSMFSSIKDIDGFLIGGASRSSKKFIDIIKNYYK